MSSPDPPEEERMKSSVLSPVDECPNCGSEELYRDIIRDPPGTVHCEDCEKQIRLPDKRSIDQKSGEEVRTGVPMFLIGCLGLWFLSGSALPENTLYKSILLTAFVVSGILILVGFLRSIEGIACFAEMSTLGEYSVETRWGRLSLADLVATLIAGAVPGVWIWYSQPFGPVESYVRGILLLVTLTILLALFNAFLSIFPDENDVIEVDS